jgi:hypothetical protein
MKAALEPCPQAPDAARQLIEAIERPATEKAQ